MQHFGLAALREDFEGLFLKRQPPRLITDQRNAACDDVLVGHGDHGFADVVLDLGVGTAFADDRLAVCKQIRRASDLVQAVFIKMHVEHDLGVGDRGIAFGAVDAEEMLHVETCFVQAFQDRRAAVVEAAVEQHVGRWCLRLATRHLGRIADLEAADVRRAHQALDLRDVARAVVPHRQTAHQVGVNRACADVESAQLLEVYDHGIGRDAVGAFG